MLSREQILLLRSDTDVLEEGFDIKCYEIGLGGDNQNLLIWSNVKPFVEWLQRVDFESKEK